MSALSWVAVGIGKRPVRGARRDFDRRLRGAGDAAAVRWLGSVCADVCAVDPGAGLVLFGSRAAGTADRHADFDLAVGLVGSRPTRSFARVLSRLAARPDHILTVRLTASHAGAVFEDGDAGSTTLRRLDLHGFGSAGLAALLRRAAADRTSVISRPTPRPAAPDLEVALDSLDRGPAVAAWWALAARRRVARRDGWEAEDLLQRARVALADVLRDGRAPRQGASGIGLSPVDRRRLAALRPGDLRAASLRRAVGRTLRLAISVAVRSGDEGLACRIAGLERGLR